MSEEILIRQGAPTLAGIKTGSLFPCPCEDRENLLTDIRRLNRLLVPKGLCLLPIRFLEGHNRGPRQAPRTSSCAECPLQASDTAQSSAKTDRESRWRTCNRSPLLNKSDGYIIAQRAFCVKTAHRQEPIKERQTIVKWRL